MFIFDGLLRKKLEEDKPLAIKGNWVEHHPPNFLPGTGSNFQVFFNRFFVNLLQPKSSLFLFFLLSTEDRGSMTTLEGASGPESFTGGF